jgi:hypothetical protein
VLSVTTSRRSGQQPNSAPHPDARASAVLCEGPPAAARGWPRTLDLTTRLDAHKVPQMWNASRAANAIRHPGPVLAIRSVAMPNVSLTASVSCAFLLPLWSASSGSHGGIPVALSSARRRRLAMGANRATRHVGRGSLVHGAVRHGGCRVVRSNPPVNADARGRAAICLRRRARAGYRARYAA